MVAVLLLATCAVVPIFAQNEQSDVHVVPREQKKDAKPDPTVMPPAIAAEAKAAGVSVDPSLKTHTKPIRKDVDLVLVPVTVTDPMNRLVTGLEKDNFLLTDNGQPQEIRHFSSEDAPISLGVIFDISGSMSNKIDKSRDAVVEFFKTANPEDEFFLITFSEKPEVLADFTTSVEDIQSKLVYAVPKGRTALLDAIYLGMNRMRKAKHEKKALLIISDGGDNHSRYTEARNQVDGEGGRCADLRHWPLRPRFQDRRGAGRPSNCCPRFPMSPAVAPSPLGHPTNWPTWRPRSESNCAISTYLDTVPPIRLGTANGERSR